MSGTTPSKLVDEVCIVLCGEAGQGIQTVEHLLTRVLKLSGYHVFATKEYMSRIRGGSNSTLIRVSSHHVSAPVDRLDIFVPLSKGAVRHMGKRISPETLVLGDRDTYEAEYSGKKAVHVPLSEIAAQVGGRIYANTVAVGVLAGLLGARLKVLTDYLARHFSAKGERVVHQNIEAAKRGWALARGIPQSEAPRLRLRRAPQVADEILLSGAEAVALGAVVGGCDFTAFYPMSPATGVSAFLAQHASQLGIVVEQAEDEIAAVNMAIGAWYAGARALVSTSGGGFALMVEGLSLAGMLESPLVIHLAQRPGPATGLPTRTEQGDLLFALCAGHGEFPRVVFAPGTLQDAFYLTQKAFNLADRYQVPVLVLTDQSLMDSYCNVPALDLSGLKVEPSLVETRADYARYALTKTGVSPRGIPGLGEGLVCVDSDEHDERGHITEDLAVRQAMVEKRLRKLGPITQEATPPDLIGDPDCETLVIGWGSTYPVLREAAARLGRDDLSVLHFKQVWPLHPETAEYINKARRLVVVENNATGQFAQLIKLHLGLDIQHKLLKYNGLPFSVEEVAEGLQSLRR